MNTLRITRREAMATAAGTGLALWSTTRAAAEEKRLFKIGACDWSIQRGADVGAFEMAARLGLKGVQVSFGKPGEKYDLRQESVRREYLEASKKHGVEIASLGMGMLNQVPYASSPEAERWVYECVEIMPKLQQKVVLVAFFSEGDIKDRPDLQREVVRRLKRVAPVAEKAGVVLGIESWLNATDHLRILDAVGSPAVQVYYDVANMTQQGYDIFKELRQIGADRICEIHCKENGFLLGQGLVDFPRVKQTLDEIGWTGWLIIEGAVGKGMKMEEAYVKNRKYLESLFPTA
jgi:sugar phosphate isomerase/epimerase